MGSWIPIQPSSKRLLPKNAALNPHSGPLTHTHTHTVQSCGKLQGTVRSELPVDPFKDPQVSPEPTSGCKKPTAHPALSARVVCTSAAAALHPGWQRTTTERTPQPPRDAPIPLLWRGSAVWFSRASCQALRAVIGFSDPDQFALPKEQRK